MTTLHLLVVAIIQGLTEFLPISSQAHLILIPRVTDWCDQGLLIDIAVHLGTLFAVLVYFWRDCWGMSRGGISLIRGRVTPEGRLFLLLVLATVPVVIAGFVMKEILNLELRNIVVIGWTTIGFGILLWLADRSGLRIRRVEHMTASSALFIGLAQILALIPGTSRSGITITAARLLGFERRDAARFTMLMAIPVILAASTLGGRDLILAGDPILTAQAGQAMLLAFLAALAAVALLMAWLRRASFTPFVVYRLILGAGLLFAAYGLGFEASLTDDACIAG